MQEPKYIVADTNTMEWQALPGIGPPSRDAKGGVFLTIAPEPMLARWQEYLKEHEGHETRVYRVYGRDFWSLPAATQPDADGS